MKRHLIVPLFFGGILAAGTPSAADEPEVLLLDAARTAGAEAAPLVFERESEAGAEGDTDRRISGKTILLATAIVSAAIVSAAWLMRSRCEPTDGIFVRFPNPPWPRHDTLPDGTLVHRASPPAPDFPLPTVCAPRQ